MFLDKMENDGIFSTLFLPTCQVFAIFILDIYSFNGLSQTWVEYFKVHNNFAKKSQLFSSVG